MRWFKHYSDNYRGRSVEELYNKMGHTGISCYFILTEICTEKLEKNKNKDLEISDCLFGFSLRFIRRNLRISSAKLEVFLRISSGLGLFSFELSEKELKINYPILLELLDSDSKRTRSRRERDATISRPDRDIDRDREVYGDLAPPTSLNQLEQKQESLHELMCLWNEHATNLSKVLKTNPERNKKTNAIWKYQTRDEWIETITRINKSDFCCGKNDRNWRASFDFILKKIAYLEVNEGKFDNNLAQKPKYETLGND